MNKTECLDLLNHSFKTYNGFVDEDFTRSEFLSSFVFDFTTYDSEIDELFVKKQ